MKIEIVDYYPHKTIKKVTYGTLHVYVCDMDMDIRGIRVAVENKKIWIEMPFSKVIDKETGELVRFPLISFTEKEKDINLRNAIIEKGREFIKKKLEEKSLNKTLGRQKLPT